MRGRFVHITTSVPPPGAQRGARERWLLRLRPLWPLFREGTALLKPGGRWRVAAVRVVFPFVFAAINRADWEFLLPYYPDDYEIHVDPRAVTQMQLDPVYRGKTAIPEMLRGWGDAFSEWRWEVADVIDGPAMWIGLGEVTGIGATSGVPVRRRIAIVSRMRRGYIAEQRLFWEWEDALENAGLPALDEIPKA